MLEMIALEHGLDPAKMPAETAWLFFENDKGERQVSREYSRACVALGEERAVVQHNKAADNG
ncbi:MAG: hypothetical protein ACTSX8_08505, partial [Alphaproteobacteria bacterium]